MTWPLQPIIFHKRQNSLGRYFASEGNIASAHTLTGGKTDKSANCLAGHGRVGLKKNKYLRQIGWMLRATGGPGLKNPGRCHLYCVYNHLNKQIQIRFSNSIQLFMYRKSRPKCPQTETARPNWPERIGQTEKSSTHTVVSKREIRFAFKVGIISSL